jgi:hypothetical protein
MKSKCIITVLKTKVLWMWGKFNDQFIQNLGISGQFHTSCVYT